MDELNRLEKSLLQHVGKAVHDFSLIEEGDRIMVAISGGKDSYTMLHLLRVLQRRAPVKFDLIAVNLDQGHPGFPADVLRGWLEKNEYPHRLLKEDTYSIVLDKLKPGQTQCSLCSRLRRGILYTAAVDMGCTKVALGHHRDDLIHTFLLNQFFAGTTATMPPKLKSNDGRNTVIRPLAYAPETEIACPAWPSVIRRSDAIGVSRLTGMNSDATSANAPSDRASTAPQFASAPSISARLVEICASIVIHLDLCRPRERQSAAARPVVRAVHLNC